MSSLNDSIHGIIHCRKPKAWFWLAHGFCGSRRRIRRHIHVPQASPDKSELAFSSLNNSIHGIIHCRKPKAWFWLAPGFNGLRHRIRRHIHVPRARSDKSDLASYSLNNSSHGIVHCRRRAANAIIARSTGPGGVKMRFFPDFGGGCDPGHVNLSSLVLDFFNPKDRKRHESAVSGANRMMKVHFRTQIFSMMLVALGWQIQASALEPVAQEPAAGRVSMVLGAAWLDKPGADRRRISIGMQVGAGDLVQTEPNGHVHIRFIDNALVSVRPDSRLEIVRYEYNRENPALSTVKFGLIEGVTRSISGAAATSARQRFRLNTPIAAIGVRGTDFVVSATRDSVRALVNEGSIVLAPYSAECAAEAFGPCVANAVELSGASEQMLGFDISSPAPRVLSAVHEFEPDALRGDIVGPIEEAAEIEEGFITANDGYLEGITNDRVSAGLANLGSSAAALGAGDGSLSIIVSDFTPVVPFGAEQTVERQLVWGRWGAGKGVLERITYAYEDVGQGRQVSVGNLEYALFRPGLGSRNVNSGLGAVKFNLAAAQAFYENGDNAVAMQVRGGDLSINFDRSVFSTGLELHHDLTGAVLFSAEGRIHDGGFFRMNGNGRRLSGAVTLDGKEAGYHFQQQLEQGNISGLTLWDSR